MAPKRANVTSRFGLPDEGEATLARHLRLSRRGEDYQREQRGQGSSVMATSGGAMPMFRPVEVSAALMIVRAWLLLAFQSQHVQLTGRD